MGRKKQIAVALLEVVFVAFSYASPTVQTESTRVQGGYVESAQCKVPRLSAKHFGSSFDRLIFCALLFFSSGHQRLHVQVHCYSAVLSRGLTSELHIVRRGQS